MKVEIAIEQLILHGFSERDAFYIKREVERSLARLIEIHGTTRLQSLQTKVGSLESPQVKIKSHSRPEITGKEIARSLYNGLNQTPSKNSS